MNNELGDQPIAQQRIIEDLIYEHARVARDIIQIDTQTWAIHGFIAVDGEVIMAEFNSRNDAEAAIEQLWAGEVP